MNNETTTQTTSSWTNTDGVTVTCVITIVVCDFGIKDEKGRAVCGVLTVYDLSIGGMTGCVQAGRDGARYGASQRSKSFTSLEQALEYARVQWAKQAKSYAKKYATKVE
jgi:hypothetical protein